ncbi:MAG TPA: ABC transporter ATP-binding protein [Ferrovibrio sp.]|jgi:zinc/manganese transport system ATP-binding protein|uniref:metal ABC transporter ATP-binding protein n=1 Tax=Ferrovibrio sp. TaxID=1917215 RepID=UPI002ED5B8D3
MNSLAGTMASLAGEIRLRNLTVSYNRHPAVHHVSGRFAPGSLTAIVGPNGAGKSSLLKAIVGLLPAADGAIERDHLQPADIAYLPQQANIDRAYPISVLELALLGHWRRSGAFGGVGRKGIAAARTALQAVGLEGFEDRPIASLSVGQLQRAMFARVLVQDAKVILLDEPFNALDARTIADLLGLLQRWHGERRTVIAVLHDFDLVRRHFPQALYLARRLIAWGRAETVLTAENQLAARRMAESWDEQAAICHTDTHTHTGHAA